MLRGFSLLQNWSGSRHWLSNRQAPPSWTTKEGFECRLFMFFKLKLVSHSKSYKEYLSNRQAPPSWTKEEGFNCRLFMFFRTGSGFPILNPIKNIVFVSHLASPCHCLGWALKSKNKLCILIQREIIFLLAWLKCIQVKTTYNNRWSQAHNFTEKSSLSYFSLEIKKGT